MNDDDIIATIAKLSNEQLGRVIAFHRHHLELCYAEQIKRFPEPFEQLPTWPVAVTRKLCSEITDAIQTEEAHDGSTNCCGGTCHGVRGC